MAEVIAKFEAIANISALVKHHAFDSGHDNGEYFNFTFGTPNAGDLWMMIQSNLYGRDNVGGHMRKASMAMCSSEEGWDEYLLLYHFDPTVAVDDDAAL
ncbi:MAG: hypothetical protein WC736_12405 [Gallionella sp.]|jgi:hypothetical protein